jgi:hypothetical protein
LGRNFRGDERGDNLFISDTHRQKLGGRDLSQSALPPRALLSGSQTDRHRRMPVILHPHNWLIDMDVPGDGLPLGNQENRNVCKEGFLARRNLAKDRAGLERS